MLFWKIYFWFFVTLLVVGYGTEGFSGIWDIIDLLISMGALVGFFLYAYQKRFLNATFWKIYFPLHIIWDFSFNLIIDPRVSGNAFDAMVFIGFLFIIPVYIAIYLYAFRFFKENDGFFTFNGNGQS